MPMPRAPQILCSKGDKDSKAWEGLEQPHKIFHPCRGLIRLQRQIIYSVIRYHLVQRASGQHKKLPYEHQG